MKITLPLKNGVPASSTWVPEGHWKTMLEFLCEKFPGVSEEMWASRLQRGLVVDENGNSIAANALLLAKTRIYYYREVDDEIPLPFKEQIIFQDENLLVVDKPHFMQVIPRGRYLHQTLLVRLQNQLNLPELSPLHRLDRETAGVMLFSKTPHTRADYQNLFATRKIHKLYHAVAASSPNLQFPLTIHSRIVRGEPFFTMKEVEGAANSETLVEILENLGKRCLYKLQPVTGKTHQLRVHMASLGIAIENDPVYPELKTKQPGDYSKPLKLLAKSVSFKCPLTRKKVTFESTQELL